MTCVDAHIKTLLLKLQRFEFNPLTAKLFNLNFHLHEVVSR